MSTTQALVTQFIALETDAARLAFLAAQQDALTLDFFTALKAHTDRLALESPDQALALAQHIAEAADTTGEPRASALASWAQGNAWLCLGRYAAALACYQAAIPPYQDSHDTLAVGRLQTNIVGVLKNLGRYAEALAVADRAQHTLRPWIDSRYMATLKMNQGSLYRLLGQYPEALEAYTQGREIFEALGKAVQVARMDINRARVLVYLDHFDDAAALLHSALHGLETASQRLPAARAQLNLATLRSRQGLHRQALETYRQARATFQALGNETDVAVVDLYTTYDYLALNLLPETLDMATQVKEAFRVLVMPRYQALARSNQAVAMRKLGRYQEALAEWEAARATFLARGVAVEVARIDVERAKALLDLSMYADAHRVAQAAQQSLSQHGLSLGAIEAQIVCAESLLGLEKIAESSALYAALSQRTDLPAALQWRVHAGLGQLAELQGDFHQALHAYQAAIACIEWVEQVLETAEFRAGFLDDKLNVYQRGVQVALKVQAFDTAHRLATQAKSGVWRAAVRAPGQITQPTAELATLRQQWHWLYNQLARLEADDADDLAEPKRSSERYATRWSRLRRVERQLAQAYRTLDTRLPENSSRPGADVQHRIPPDTVLLDYYCTAEDIHLFLVTHTEVRTLASLTSTVAVERLVNQWRFNLDSMRAGTLADRQTLDLADQAYDILQHLYQLLIAPVRAHLEGVQHLWIMPHATLWEVPFVALYDGERCLIEQWSPTLIPGWVEQPGSDVPTTVNVLTQPVVVGHTDNGRLQYTLEEARAVAAMVGAAPLMEEAATVPQVQAAAASCSLLHIATHGWFRADAPLFSVLHLADGAITAKELETWTLPNTQLVTLSACETGRNFNRGSDLLGLSRSFFKAGARRLLVSLWAVDDVATTELMVRFYQRLRAGAPISAAWQAAQRAALVKYRHPFYWAGFVLLDLQSW